MKKKRNSIRKRMMPGIAPLAFALLTGFMPANKLTATYPHPPQTSLSAPELSRMCRILGNILDSPPGHIHQMVRRGEIVIHPTVDGCLYKVDYAGICIDVDGCI